MILEVSAVAIEEEDNVLNAHTVIGLDTPMLDAISYMTNLPILLIWLNLLIIQRVSSSVSGSSSTPQGVIITPGEYEEYLRLTQAANSSSNASIAQVSAYLTRSSAPWILDTRAPDHISVNKNLNIHEGLYLVCLTLHMRV